MAAALFLQYFGIFLLLWEDALFQGAQITQIELSFESRLLIFHLIQQELVAQLFAAFRIRAFTVDVLDPAQNGVSGAFALVELAEGLAFLTKPVMAGSSGYWRPRYCRDQWVRLENRNAASSSRLWAVTMAS